MSEAIAAIEAIVAFAPEGKLNPTSASVAAPDFAEFMRPLAQADEALKTAEGSLQRMAAGEPQELHEVMIDLERARLSVLTLIQVRNKALEAWQELTRMQV
ncbi:flagellar hook-basal body complex protein FliE [Niveibacterium sp. COAC-50]|uniref:flagellar hook-basal body complex protein FliE n=1 Tax=Niveibacterium sp. COAC-50 TaxID=2729384 RepID=UPI0015565F0A|nr:flagellar hook-basal body complex protein FliE [Niveibacterium sp. COAC-50]